MSEKRLTGCIARENIKPMAVPRDRMTDVLTLAQQSHGNSAALCL
jgi:hypothetical protein